MTTSLKRVYLLPELESTGLDGKAWLTSCIRVSPEAKQLLLSPAFVGAQITYRDGVIVSPEHLLVSPETTFDKLKRRLNKRQGGLNTLPMEFAPVLLLSIVLGGVHIPSGLKELVFLHDSVWIGSGSRTLPKVFSIDLTEGSLGAVDAWGKTQVYRSGRAFVLSQVENLD